MAENPRQLTRRERLMRQVKKAEEKLDGSWPKPPFDDTRGVVDPYRERKLILDTLEAMDYFLSHRKANGVSIGLPITGNFEIQLEG